MTPTDAETIAVLDQLNRNQARMLEEARAAVAELVEALEKVGTVNPVLQPVNEHTERIWASTVSVRPTEKRYCGDRLTGAEAKAIRDLINKHKKVT